MARFDERPEPPADISSMFAPMPRLPPSNVPAEQALLGAIMANNKAYNAVSSFLRPEMFADPINGRIYQAVARRVDGGQVADAVTLKAEFENSGILAEVGGVSYLTQLLAAMVSPMMAGDYGRAVHDTWARRQIIEISEAMALSAYGSGNETSAVEQIAMIQDEIAALESAVGSYDSGPPRGGTTTLFEAFQSAVDRAEGIAKGDIAQPFSTGQPGVDALLDGGISPDSMIYLIGAAEAGKTELALQMAEAVGAQAYSRWQEEGAVGPCPGVLYIMLGNMNARQLGARAAARAAGMRAAPIRRGSIDMEQAARLVQAGSVVAQIPVEISDSGPTTVARVLGEMRRFARRRPLVLTVIDNFSDILSATPDKMYQTAISATPALKTQGATATKSAVMLLMHLNSSVDSDKNRTPRPRPSDIPWGTKKDADFAIGVWRPIKHEPSEPQKIKASAKNTNAQELEAQWFKEWSDKREPWPVGISDITEVVPMKLREDDGASRSIVKLRFDLNTHRFIDVETEKQASAASALFEEDAF